MKMVLEVMALIKDMNKLINDEDVLRDFTLVDKSSVPLMLLVLITRGCFHLWKRLTVQNLLMGQNQMTI